MIARLKSAYLGLRLIWSNLWNWSLQHMNLFKISVFFASSSLFSFSQETSLIIADLELEANETVPARINVGGGLQWKGKVVLSTNAGRRGSRGASNRTKVRKTLNYFCCSFRRTRRRRKTKDQVNLFTQHCKDRPKLTRMCSYRGKSTLSGITRSQPEPLARPVNWFNDDGGWTRWNFKRPFLTALIILI